MSFEKILIANRGEIACRVIRTARALGYPTVAVYSAADIDAPHTRLADEAVAIGPAAVGASYLNGERILAAAQRVGADAIHPGYGFLSENAEFAQTCADAGIVFIGPPVEAIALMGSKRLSKIAMQEAGVPCVPGYQDADQSDATLIAQAQRIGMPVMIKASAGGGGRGMRLVHHAQALAEQIASARSEAQNAFGSGELILEKAVIAPRHVEIQVFADAHGQVLHLGERDCSIQRRHQKVVEEAPSPGVDPDLRAQMGAAAVAAARACQYRGAGTVEFLLDAERQFYFLEMNTRLQVEHPVTEMVTGLDLVEWQIRVARGEPLPLTQEQVRLSGHAVEVRLYAEDPRQEFLPQTGELHRWQPATGAGLRCDNGVSAGQTIGAHYDPMLAKLIAWAPDRATALRKLALAVADSRVLGINSNKHFLLQVLRHPVFRAGEATTHFIADHLPAAPAAAPTAPTLACAAALLYLRGRAQVAPQYHWQRADAEGGILQLEYRGERTALSVRVRGREFAVQQGAQTTSLALRDVGPDTARIEIDGVTRRCDYLIHKDVVFLDTGDGHYALQDVTQQPARAADAAADGAVRAAMDGVIVAIHAAAGDVVRAGQTVIVMEAMKMEHALKAGIDGRLETLSAAVGQQVKARQLLAQLAPAAEDPA